MSILRDAFHQRTIVHGYFENIDLLSLNDHAFSEINPTSHLTFVGCKLKQLYPFYVSLKEIKFIDSNITEIQSFVFDRRIDFIELKNCRIGTIRGGAFTNKVGEVLSLYFI